MKVTKHPLCSASTDERLKGIPPDQELVRRLETSFARLSADGGRLSELFYARLFAAHPQVRAMFPSDMTAQRKKLVDLLVSVFQDLGDADTARVRLEELGCSHVKYGARPEHYPLVCEALVGAMGEVMGNDWSPELEADWKEAMRQVSGIMIGAAESESK